MSWQDGRTQVWTLVVEKEELYSLNASHSQARIARVMSTIFPLNFQCNCIGDSVAGHWLHMLPDIVVNTLQ